MTTIVARFKELTSNGPLPGLVWHIEADGNGCAREMPPGRALTEMDQGWNWLHFNLADDRATTLLDALPGLPQQALQLLKVRDELPQMHSDGAISYGLIADLQRNIGESTDSIGLLHFIMTERLLVTARRSPLTAAGTTRTLLRDGLKLTSIEGVLETIIEQVLEAVDNYIERLSREVDTLEDQIVAGFVGDARVQLARCRRTTVRLRRHITELRLLFQRLDRENKRTSVTPNLLAVAARRLQESERVDREIAALGDRTRLLQDEVVALLTEETNKHLRVLSVLSILFMPPTFIAGLFGMNLKGILFDAHQNGFWAATSLAIFSSVFVVWLLWWTGVLGKRNRD